ncbi:hypothetical protein CRN00_12295 [Enterococcus faecium]|nr:glycosyltransferase family 4 protein [Enterococcus faecium]PEQ19854.1 hypothetical protein CRN00_12295 [Enterococcus faecium]
MMKVWIVGVGEPLPIDGENTRLRRIGNFSNYLSENGHSVDWFSVSFDHYKKRQRVQQNQTFILNERLKLHVAKVSGYKKNISLQRIYHHYDASKQIFKLLKKEPKPDVILSGNTPIEVITMVTKYGKDNNIPVITDVRDLWPDIFKESMPEKFRSLITPYVVFSNKKVDTYFRNSYSIVGLSEGFLSFGLEHAKRSRKKTDTVIPIAYPDYSYNYSENEFSSLWSKHGVESNDFIISFTGNFGNQFSFESIINASNKLTGISNLKFVLCGTGPQMEYVKSKCSDNVIFPGWIEKDMITSLLQWSKLGIAPYINSTNYQLNTPNKFGEYLSASLPILLSVDGVMKNLVDEYHCGSYYKDGSALEKIIKNYFDNFGKLYSESINARSLYEANFQIDIVQEKFMKHLQFVIDEYKLTGGKYEQDKKSLF